MSKQDIEIDNTSTSEAWGENKNLMIGSGKNTNPIFKSKKTVAITIAVVIALVTLFVLGANFIPMWVSNNSDFSTCQISMYAELNGIKIEDGGTYNVRPGDIITVEASSSEATIEMIGYCWGYDNDSEIIDERSNRITIIVPENDEGYTELLRVEAVASNDRGGANTETKTGWKKYTLKYSIASNYVSDNKSELITFANGDVYEGELVDGKPHGQGTLTYANGDIYEGQWKNGKREGDGTLTWSSTGVYYKGNFTDGNIAGYGTFYPKTAEPVSAVWKWVNGRQEAIGGYTGRYEGMMCDQKLNGYGIFVHDYPGHEGVSRTIEGEFKDGTIHGYIKLTQTTEGAVYGEYGALIMNDYIYYDEATNGTFSTINHMYYDGATK
ncbi:MAG: hypothetical protein IKJ59_14105 [Clostridia bacterium]|nr:hypothetical protein [Clostridia bacterium]